MPSSIRDPGEIDYLLTPNAVRVGNLDFRLSPADSEPFFDVPEYVDLPDIIKVAEMIDEGIPLNDRQ